MIACVGKRGWDPVPSGKTAWLGSQAVYPLQQGRSQGTEAGRY